ncbi:MAG: hypothetical protein V4547_18410, partial [Bacteroidota bacterium]
SSLFSCSCNSQAAVMFAIQAIQTSAVNGLAFTIELILLRTLNTINNEVKIKIADTNECVQIVQYFYLSFYNAARLNFHQKFNVKEIDWENKESKVKDLFPKWRRDNMETPQIRSNRHAKELISKVENGSVKINAMGIVKTRKASVQVSTSQLPESSRMETEPQQNEGQEENNTNKTKGSTRGGKHFHAPRRNGNSKDDGATMGVKELTKTKNKLSLTARRQNAFDKRRNFTEDDTTDHQTNKILIN